MTYLQFFSFETIIRRPVHVPLVFLCSIFLLFTISCKETSDPTPPETKSRFKFEKDVANHLSFTFTNESQNADTYLWDFGDGETSTSTATTLTHTYAEPSSYPKDYTVSLKASKGTASHTTTATVTITSPDAAAEQKKLLTGITSKTWKLARQAASLYISPADFSQTWWSIKDTDLKQRPCLYKYEFIFKPDNTYTIETNDQVWLEANTLSEGSKEGCKDGTTLDKNKDGTSIREWNGGEFTYTLTPVDNDAQKVATLKVDGLGSFVGFPKASGAGITEASAPASSTTYDVYKLINGGDQPDTLLVAYPFDNEGTPGIWQMTLVSYENPADEPSLGDPDPVSSFTYAKSTTDYKSYTFTNTSQFAASYSWAFGDGNTSADENPTHTYADDGTYEVTLMVTTDKGVTKESKQTIIVANVSAVADADQDLDPSDGTFSMTFAADPSFVGFGEATYSYENNPAVSAANNSAKSGKIANLGNNGWEGIAVELPAKFNFSTNTSISVKVFSPASGSTIRLKLEDATNADLNKEVDATTTVANAWETLTFQFSAEDNNKFDKLVIFGGFEIVNPKEALPGSQVFYFDDIQLVGSSSPPPPPGPDAVADADQDLDPSDGTFSMTFAVDPNFTGFEGATYSYEDNPAVSTANNSAKVGKIANTGAKGWEGVEVVLSSKFAFSTNTSISVKVFSPASGSTIRLKLEDKADATIYKELDATTTVANAWETLTFQFSEEDNNKFDKIAFFGGFEIVDGNGPKVALPGSQVFYFDDIQLVGSSSPPPPPGPDAVADADQDLDPSDGTFSMTFAADPDFTGFEGATYSYEDNPAVSTANNSAKVGKIANTGAKGWEGVEVVLSSKFTFSTNTSISVKVFSPVSGSTIRLKLEDKADATIYKELDATTTVANAWETLTFQFSEEDNNKFDKIAFFGGFEIVDGNGPKVALPGSQVFYFDDIQLVGSSSPPPPPGPDAVADADQDLDPSDGTFSMTFATDPDFTGFEGATYSYEDNPAVSTANNSAKVGKIANTGAKGWEGVEVVLSSKFTFSTNTSISVKVFSPASGSTIRLKLEDKADATIYKELDATTTVANAWETLTFQFSEEDNNKFDKIAFFGGFEIVDGNGPKVALPGSQVFYFDDIQLVGSSSPPPPPGPDAVADADQDLDPSDGTFSMTFAVDPSFVGFGDATYTYEDNPSVSSANNSAKVGKIANLGNNGWEGIAVELPAKFNFSTDTFISVKVFSPAAGSVIKLKLEDATNADLNKEVDVPTTVANAWETLTFQFSAEDNNKFDKLVIFGGFEIVNPKVALQGSQVFYFDDIQLGQ